VHSSVQTELVVK